MALPNQRKNTAVRVAFITDWMFQRLPTEQQQEFKKRAVRRLSQIARYPVVENSSNPDATFYVMRQPGSHSWMLRKAGTV